MEICITVEYDEISLRGGVGDCKLSWVLFSICGNSAFSPSFCRQTVCSLVVKSAVLCVRPRSKGVGTLVQPYGTTRISCSVRLAEKRTKNRMKNPPLVKFFGVK